MFLTTQTPNMRISVFDLHVRDQIIESDYLTSINCMRKLIKQVLNQN